MKHFTIGKINWNPLYLIMSINVCIPGISGKMGMEIAKLVLLEKSNMRLSSAIMRNHNEENNSLSNIDKKI